MRALKHHQMLYKVNRRLVTTQAHEGIETRDKSNASFSETRNNSSP